MRTTFVVIPALLLACAAEGGRAADWLPATGTGTCSVTDLDFSGVGDGFAAGAFNCGLITDDGGISWQPIDVIPQQGQSLVFAHAATTDSFYAARGGLYQSLDRGQTWSEIGNLSAKNGSIFDIHFADPSRWVAIKGGQLHLTVDAGAAWTLVFPGKITINFDELHFPDAQTGYATGGVFREFGEFGTVLRSDDGGTTWTQLEFPHGMITAADFVDVQHGVVATFNQGLYETTDGAQTWQHLADTPGASVLTDLVHRGTHWYAGSMSGCLHESFDSGRTWHEAWCDSAERAITSLSARGRAVVAAGDSGLVVYENRIFGDGFDDN